MKDRCFLMQPKLNVAVLYVHVPGCETHAAHAKRFVGTLEKYPALFPFRLVVIVNGCKLHDETRKLFIPHNPEYFVHDDSGWDIGAYQHYCEQSTDDMVLFLGGSAYFRREGWLKRMAEVFLEHNGVGLYGSTGNLGHPRTTIFAHIRTTGFWCSPEVMNAYPQKITEHHQRYPFEHGKNGLTRWCMSSGIPARVVDFSNVWEHPQWHLGPQGYHAGEQIDLLVGDRMTCPPFYPHP